MNDPSYEALLAEPVEATLATESKGSFSSIGSLAIVLGLAGLIGLCFSGSFLLANYNAAPPTAPPPNAPAVQRFQYEISVDMQAIAQRYSPALAVFAVWQGAAVILLIIGGIRVMRRSEGGRRFMLYVLLMLLLFEVLRSGLYIVMMLELMPFVDEALVRAIREAGDQNEQITKIMKRMALGVTVIAILMSLVWPAIKILFYGWGARYLSSSEALELCASPTQLHQESS